MTCHVKISYRSVSEGLQASATSSEPARELLLGPPTVGSEPRLRQGIRAETCALYPIFPPYEILQGPAELADTNVTAEELQTMLAQKLRMDADLRSG